MTTPIDPLILRKLDDFRQRRRKLIILRGICAAAATLLLAMMVVALVDAIFVLPDVARWSLSGAAYLTVIVVEWRASLRLLIRTPGRRELARMVEVTEPKLRESLLASVELSEQDPAATGLSQQFRQLLERDVAKQLLTTDVDRLLPVNLVRRSIAVGLTALALCIVIFALTGMQFGTLLLRALAPGANLARVSQVKVRVVEPSAPDKVVAQGETEPLVIEISGKRVSTARLETLTASGRDVVKMTPLPGDRFSATIQVGREDVTYRVFAGDAVTKKFRLQAVSRPHVATFEKTFTFPSYVKREPQSVKEENGDLIALEGTEVELRLTTNQPVREGELRIDQGRQSSVVKLEPDNGGLVARVPLKTSGTYRVHLVGAETGFENKFSPEYELRAEPDLVPQVDLETPKQDLILPANEIIGLRGTASDDQGLAKVSQFVKINEGGWREVPLATAPGKSAVVTRSWDLYEQGVKPGDLLTTKLVAQDLKGARTESRVVRVSITKSGFETKRLEALEAQRALAAALQALREAGEIFAKRGKEARQQFDRLAEGDEQRRQVLITAESAYAEFEQARAAAWTQLDATLRRAESGHAGADLAQVGRTLVRAGAGFAAAGKAALDVVAIDPMKPHARELMRDFAEAAEKTEQRTRKAEDSHRVFLMGEEFGVIAENLAVIASESRRLVELANQASDTTQWTQVANRLRVVLSESRSVEEVADKGVPRNGDRLKWVRKQLGDTRGIAERTLATGEPGPALREVTQNFLRIAEAVSRNALDNYRDLAHRGANEHLDLLREGHITPAVFDRLHEDFKRIAAEKNWPEEARQARAERLWETRGAMLKQQGDLEEARPAADSFFVNDLRVTTLALAALPMNAENADPAVLRPKLIAVERNFRLLEAGHSLAEILDGLQHLSAAERWEIATAHERIAGPREWRWLELRLRFAPDELGRTQQEDPVRGIVQQAQQAAIRALQVPGWNPLNQEMNERFNPQREIRSTAQEIEMIAVPVKEALELLRKPMEEARKQIAAMAPKLHEMMKNLAEKSEELKQKTEEQAKAAPEQKPEQTQAEAQQALAQQQKLNERVEALKDALRADANQQDILKDEGRERARDADDALALLKEPPPNAEAALNEAAQAADPKAKTEALQMAAQEQKKLAEALEQLAKHYENAEQGKAQETRTALRATEEQTGIKEAMDRQFAKAEDLSKMAEDSPEELLKKLEQALPKNPAMQQELSTISRNTLEEASAKLATASALENQVAGDVKKVAEEQKAQMAANAANANPPPTPDAANPSTPPAAPNSANPPAAQNPPPQQANAAAPNSPQPNAPNQNPAPAPQPPTAQNPALAPSAQKQQPIAQNATAAGDDISRAGRHEQRLNNMQTGEKLEQLGNRVKETAMTQVPKAAEALTKAQQAEQAAPEVNAANEQLQAQLGELKQAASAPKSDAAMKGADPSTPAAPMENPLGELPIPGSPQAAQPSSPAGKPAEASQANAAPSPANAPGTAEQANAKPPGTSPSANPSSAPTASAKPPPPGSSPEASTPNAGAPDATAMPPMPQLPSAFAQNPTAPASPVEQMWMARTLDALDAALNGEASSTSQQGQQGAQGQQGQQAGQQGKDGKPQPNPQGQQQGQQASQQQGQQQASAAQQAMNNAAKAAAAAMRTARADKPNQNPGDPTDDGPEQAVSRDGAQAQAAAKAHGKLKDAGGKSGEWGKLPKQVAEQLTRGQNENVAGEYRNQVETYYKVIAEKSKKP